MKKSIKTLIRIAAALMAIGSILMLASIVAGGRFKYLNDAIRNKIQWICRTGNLVRCFADIDCRLPKNVAELLAQDDFDGESFYTKSSKDGLKKEIYTYEGKSIHSLTIELNAGQMHIEQGKEFTVEVYNGKFRKVLSRLDCAGTLEIKEYSTGSSVYPLPQNYRKAIVYIYIPAGTVLKKIDVSLNAASLQIKKPSLSTQKLSIDVNAGVVEIIKPARFFSYDTDIECNAGSITLAGSFRGKTDIDCSAGKILMNIYSDGEEYSWHVDTTLGSTWVNKVSTIGFSSGSNGKIEGATQNLGSGRKNYNHVDILCVCGNVDLSIE